MNSTKSVSFCSFGFVALAAVIFCPLNPATASETPPPNAPPLRIQVDPRIELISILFRLAGNPEYNQGKVDSYTADVEKQFGRLREHEAVRLAREFRKRRGVSYDACMSMAVHVNNAFELEPLVPLSPWPEGLDRRWTAVDAARFLEAARAFVREASFAQFVEQHGALYRKTESRLKALMDKEGHLEWFPAYFGERPNATFTIVPALLNGGACYGPHIRHQSRENFFCILGVWKTDPDGLPQFTLEILTTVVHEFGHSYANPIIEHHLPELRTAGNELYGPVAAKMRSQAYGDGSTLLRESLVRACEVRYAFRYDGPTAGRAAVSYNKGRGFLWTEELSNLLADYEAHRSAYPTLASFSPRIAAFFSEYARGFGEKQKTLESKKPHVVSLTPANGETDVDPGITAIQVVFDRPMKAGGWALVGGGPHCPETTGKPHYDAARTTWTLPVSLKPDWSYEFMLNSASYDSFRSEQGVPLDPVNVGFKTRAQSLKAKTGATE